MMFIIAYSIICPMNHRQIDTLLSYLLWMCRWFQMVDGFSDGFRCVYGFSDSLRNSSFVNFLLKINVLDGQSIMWIMISFKP